MRTLRLALASVLFVSAASFTAVPVRAQPPPAPGAATAETAAPGSELQEVTVSASAISIAGYEAPTPVTTVGLQQLESDARPDLADELRSLPTFSGSPSAENSDSSNLVSSGITGEDLLNLRNLGVNRTLVLFDGQRVVDSNIQGGVDVSLIPQTLVERVDTVTGGASAVWGSDAVAGVVNFIINKNFNGIQVNLEDSNNWQQDHEQYKAELTAGTSFADGAGHIEVAGNYWDIPNPFWTAQTQGWASQRLVSNPACSNYVGETATCPAGQPAWLHANNVGLAYETAGGVITGPLAGYTGPFPLTNIAFGPGAQEYLFNPGNVTEGFFSNGGTLNDDKGYLNLSGEPIKNETAFALLSWKFSDALSASLQLNYGTTSITNNSYSADQPGAVPIFSGNPFIPSALQAQMTALGIPGFMLGTSNENNVPGGGESFAQQASTVSIAVNQTRRTLARGVFTLTGNIGSKWTWDAYFMHGQSHMYEAPINNAFYPNLLAAEDVVTVTPAMNAANPSLPIGSPTCALNVPAALLPGGAGGAVAGAANPLGAATAGCQPLNVMGVGAASQGAINYINSVTRAGDDFQSMTLFESVAAAKLQGELPIGLPAGAIAAAAGVVYRSESGITINCGFNCTDVLFNIGNFARFGPASYNIKEENAELNIPMLKNQGVQSLSVDLAARNSEYSTSGSVQTYKFGVLSQLDDWVRVRGSYSYDIRAPDLVELFSNPLAISADLTDPRTLKEITGYTITEGNRDLQPEDAETRTFGLVLTPVQNLNIAVDWYFILIEGAINEGFPTQTVISQCLAGVAAFCEGLEWGKYPTGCIGPSITSCPGLPLGAVITEPVNSDHESISGLDFNGDYRFPFGPGALDFNSTMNYIFEQRYASVGFNCDEANAISYDEGSYCPNSTPGVPKFRGTVSATYSQGGWLATLDTRMIGATHLVNEWTNGVNVDDNDIPFYWYFDARLSYKMDNGITFYGAVDNIADKYPPVIAMTDNAISDFEAPYRDDIYDGFGRVFRVGLRAKF
jgi:iron complex outermembrane recepter protein